MPARPSGAASPPLKGAIGSNRVEDPEPGVSQRNAAGRLHRHGP